MQLTNEIDINLKAELVQVNLGRKFVGQTATILAAMPDIQLMASGLGLKPILVTNLLTEALQSLLRDPKLAEMDDYDIVDHVKNQFDDLLFDWAKRNFQNSPQILKDWTIARLDKFRKKSDYQYRQYANLNTAVQAPNQAALTTNMALPAPANLSTLDIESLPPLWRKRTDRLVKCPREDCGKVGYVTVRSDSHGSKMRYFEGIYHGGSTFHRMREVDEATFNQLVEQYKVTRGRLGKTKNAIQAEPEKAEQQAAEQMPLNVGPAKLPEDFTEADVEKIFPCPVCKNKHNGIVKKRTFRYYKDGFADIRLIIEHSKRVDPTGPRGGHSVKVIGRRNLTAEEIARGPIRANGKNRHETNPLNEAAAA